MLMEQSESFNGLGCNPDTEIEGDYVAIAKLAFKEFGNGYKKKYNLRNYALSFQTFNIQGKHVHRVSFLPNPVGLPSDGILDIAQGGVWANGPGVSYFYAADSLELVKILYMR